MLRQEEGGNRQQGSRWQQQQTQQQQQQQLGRQHLDLRRSSSEQQQQHANQMDQQTDQDAWIDLMQSVKTDKSVTNALVLDFLINEGYVEAAEAFQAETGQTGSIELKGIEERNNIRQAVQQGDIDAAIEKLNDMDPEILENNQELNFHLQQQKLIEMIRNGQVVEAIQFAQTYMSQVMYQGGNCKHMEELERAVSLLVFENPEDSPLKDLMSIAQRQKTASELNQAILQSQGDNQESCLSLLIKLMSTQQSKLAEKIHCPRFQELVSGVLEDMKNKVD